MKVVLFQEMLGLTQILLHKESDDILGEIGGPSLPRMLPRKHHDLLLGLLDIFIGNDDIRHLVMRDTIGYTLHFPSDAILSRHLLQPMQGQHQLAIAIRRIRRDSHVIVLKLEE